jgi:hypothetical protein
MLQVSLRENMTKNAKRKYFFRSSNNGELTVDQLVSEMATFNTTITEADTLGVLNVMKRLLIKYVNLGYIVHTPLGYFHASASGSTDDLLEQFDPKNHDTNHDIALLYCSSTEVNTKMKDGIQTERVTNRLITTPSIDAVKNAAGKVDAAVHPGDTVLILGDYLKYDETDEKQGIFLSKDGTETKLTYCPHNTAGQLEARIPSGLAAGTYGVIIRNVPTMTFTETTWKKTLTIAA